MTSFVLNPRARSSSPPAIFDDRDYATARAFFAARRDATPTPLRHLHELAAAIGVRDVLLKDETERFGLNAFKVLGVSFAIHQLLDQGRLGPDGVVVTATSGNHGRAVAAAARRAGVQARIYVPTVTEDARRAAIVEEGATLVVVDGSYEDAVREAARQAATNGWTVVSDTSWTGYEEIPRWIMLGYAELLSEASQQWGDRPPDVVFVQVGVGGLACAVAAWLAHHFGAARPFVIACEPSATACAMESVRAGRPVVVGGALRTVMAGLRCAEISPMVWPVLSGAVDAFVAIEDETTEAAMRRLATPLGTDPVVTAGASGACGIASLLATMAEPELEALRRASGLSPTSRAFAICTEGPTDPDHYQRVMRDP